MKIQRPYEPSRETLLIHLGGLGDLCLSESTIYSLNLSLGIKPVALGYRRFLRLFDPLFSSVESIDARFWLSLFSSDPPENVWKRIIFIGKDRNGSLRKRWQGHSLEPLIFIDMYPDESDTVNPVIHVEDYQLNQLAYYNVNAIKKDVVCRKNRRVVLYVEKGFEKKKWPPENFIHLHQRLSTRGIDAILLVQQELKSEIIGSLCIEDLLDVKTFFTQGGLLVSNDSGIAHLAGAIGLCTVTIFADFDPRVWHPRGTSVTLSMKISQSCVNLVESIVTNLLDGTDEGLNEAQRLAETPPLFRCPLKP